jgi:hypothetical protein
MKNSGLKQIRDTRVPANLPAESKADSPRVGTAGTTPPEHGADSQLHCYNAVSWRMAEMFGEDDEPEAPKKK